MVMSVIFRSCAAIGMRFEIQDGKDIAAERRRALSVVLFDLSARTSAPYIVSVCRVQLSIRFTQLSNSQRSGLVSLILTYV